MIVVVVDALNSALGRAALNRSKYQESVVLASNNFISPRSLFNAISELAPDVVLFAFRNVLADALQLTECFTLISRIHAESYFGILIPDYLEIEDEENSTTGQIVNSIDFILATNQDLLDLYMKRFGNSTFVQIYHDLVDREYISRFRNLNQARQDRLIWIGNSKWGNRQGKIDHKGFFSIVSPIFNSEKFSGWDKTIIDSSMGPMEYEDVLRQLSRSSALLHPSLSEGTGLPILESALLGVFPITTRVGIAAELLSESFPNLIIDRDLPSFFRCLETVNHLGHSERIKLVETAEQFLTQAQKEQIPETFTERKNTYRLKSNVRSILRIRLLWFYRFFKSLRS